VLLLKPGADSRVVQQCREIALYCTGQKMIQKTCIGGLNDQIQSQLAPEQLGWTQAHGATDAAILFAALHDQVLARPGVAIILFLDLKQFFPRIPPEGIALGALLHGLPPDVQQLAAQDFAVMEGRYESQKGLGDPFTIDWGALMGCVLSTQKARIMLNSLVEAILRHVRGVNLYGTLQHAAINLQADDLAAVIHADLLVAAWRDFRRLWSICCAWSVATGAQIGVKAKSKTTYAALRIDDRGGSRDVENLDTLLLLNREVLPRMGAVETYKHIGILRRMDGDSVRAARAFLNRGKAATAQLAKFALSVRGGGGGGCRRRGTE
jgi:hypothetical protein